MGLQTKFGQLHIFSTTFLLPLIQKNSVAVKCVVNYHQDLIIYFKLLRFLHINDCSLYSFLHCLNPKLSLNKEKNKTMRFTYFFRRQQLILCVMLLLVLIYLFLFASWLGRVRQQKLMSAHKTRTHHYADMLKKSKHRSYLGRP